MDELLANGAARWAALAEAMLRAGRSHGAERLAQMIEDDLNHGSTPL